jgi:hypothetical protein
MNKQEQPIFNLLGESKLPLCLKPEIMLSATLLNVFSRIVLPGQNFLLWMLVSVAIDFCTGILKAVVVDGYKSVNSKAMRATVGKLIQYGGLAVIVTVLVNTGVVKGHEETAEFLVNAIYCLAISIEMKSILENIQAISPDSSLSKLVFGPIINIVNASITKSKKTIDAVTEKPDETKK